MKGLKLETTTPRMLNRNFMFPPVLEEEDESLKFDDDKQGLVLSPARGGGLSLEINEKEEEDF